MSLFVIIQKLSVSNFLDEIQTDIDLLGQKSRHLFEIRVNVNSQYPAMEISANVMRPSRNAIFSIFNITINEFQQDSDLHKNSDEYDIVIYAQNAWISTIAEYRLYMANRIGSFDEKQLIEQEINVQTYIERMEKISQQLQARNSDQLFGFEASELIKQLPEHLQQWKNGFEQVKKINHSNRWRQDSQLMKESIVPLLNKLNKTFVKLNDKIKAENNAVLVKLKDITVNQRILLVGVILLFLIYLIISIVMLTKKMRLLLQKKSTG